MKKTVLLLALMPSLVFAAGSTITFKGQVSSQTCIIAVDGDVNPVVLLPTATTSSLAAAGSVTGETPFTVSISGCKAPVADDGLAIKMAFAVSAATGGGNIRNLGTASNVALQLLDQPGGTPVKLIGGSTASVSGLKLGKGDTETSHTFAVRYIAEGGAVGSGSVIGSVQYALDYL
jgi:major type 1 subunit fimbrin (pilin)